MSKEFVFIVTPFFKSKYRKMIQRLHGDNHVVRLKSLLKYANPNIISDVNLAKLEFLSESYQKLRVNKLSWSMELHLQFFKIKENNLFSFPDIYGEFIESLLEKVKSRENLDLNKLYQILYGRDIPTECERRVREEFFPSGSDNGILYDYHNMELILAVLDFWVVNEAGIDDLPILKNFLEDSLGKYLILDLRYIIYSYV